MERDTMSTSDVTKCITNMLADIAEFYPPNWARLKKNSFLSHRNKSYDQNIFCHSSRFD